MKVTSGFIPINMSHYIAKGILQDAIKVTNQMTLDTKIIQVDLPITWAF